MLVYSGFTKDLLRHIVIEQTISMGIPNLLTLFAILRTRLETVLEHTNLHSLCIGWAPTQLNNKWIGNNGLLQNGKCAMKYTSWEVIAEICCVVQEWDTKRKVVSRVWGRFSLSACQLAFITYIDTNLLAVVIGTNNAPQYVSNYTAKANKPVRYNTVNFNRPQTTGWPLLEQREIRMRNISWSKTSCYYPSWQHSHSSLAHYAPLKMHNVFSLCESTERPVVPTNTSPVPPPLSCSQKSPALRQTRPPFAGDHLLLCGLYFK
jgi:hypothetical protein